MKKIKNMELKNLINLLEGISLLIIMSFIYYINIPIKAEKNIYIPDSSVEDIISHLKRRGYNVSFIDKFILSFFQKPKSGWVYVGKTEIDRLNYLRLIGSNRNRYEKVQLIPGETTEFFFKYLSKKLKLSESKLKTNFYKKTSFKEAGIIAESYNIPLAYDEKRIINYLVNVTEKKYRNIAKKYNVDYSNKEKWKKILVIASIIQKEAGNNKEMPLISSVIYNRLKKKMRLQMDGALNYGKYSHTKVTPKRIKEDNTTYNTYRHRGLPENPVCNVSEVAIISAIKPAKSNYLYFMKNSQGGHNFSMSYRKHIRNIKERKREIETKN